jgi:hypothetical protein
MVMNYSQAAKNIQEFSESFKNFSENEFLGISGI